jgi:protein-disulfide isomerase
VLGAEREIISNYVNTGEVKLVFWPMLDHGNNSLNAHAAADCIGRQSVEAFWSVHDHFFANQRELWGAERSYFIDAAAGAGVDQIIFAAFYYNRIGHETVTELDKIRRDLGILNRPTFDINGTYIIGAQPFIFFSEYIESILP